MGKYLKRYSPACTRLLSQYKTMLKLVGEDVPSIESFMIRYRVRSTRIPFFYAMSFFFHYRWITLRRFIDSKSVSQLPWNIPVKQDQRRESGLRRRHK